MGLECNVLILSNVTSAKVGINPQSFPTFCFNFFGSLLYIFKAIPSANSKLFNFSQDHSSKK